MILLKLRPEVKSPLLMRDFGCVGRGDCGFGNFDGVPVWVKIRFEMVCTGAAAYQTSLTAKRLASV